MNTKIKKLTYLAVICSLFIAFSSTAQDLSEQYKKLTRSAFALYNSKEYKKSAVTYEEAFKDMKGLATALDRYNAACSWAMAGNKDSAFYHLEYLGKKVGYSNEGHITTDTDLISLHSDKRWATLLGLVNQNKIAAEAKLDKVLMKKIDVILASDQGGRKKIDSLRRVGSLQTPEAQKVIKEIKFADSVNLTRVKAILKEYGWPGPEQIGQNGGTSLFLVIQHSDLATQKQFLPMLTQAAKDKKLNPSNLALLEDRIAISEGRKQVYGSQLKPDPNTGKPAFAPIEDEKNVNKRRASVGLEPLEDYARRFNFEYTLPKT